MKSFKDYLNEEKLNEELEDKSKPFSIPFDEKLFLKQFKKFKQRAGKNSGWRASYDFKNDLPTKKLETPEDAIKELKNGRSIEWIRNGDYMGKMQKSGNKLNVIPNPKASNVSMFYNAMFDLIKFESVELTEAKQVTIADLDITRSGSSVPVIVRNKGAKDSIITKLKRNGDYDGSTLKVNTNALSNFRKANLDSEGVVQLKESKQTPKSKKIYSAINKFGNRWMMDAARKAGIEKDALIWDHFAVDYDPHFLATFGIKGMTQVIEIQIQGVLSKDKKFVKEFVNMVQTNLGVTFISSQSDYMPSLEAYLFLFAGTE